MDNLAGLLTVPEAARRLDRSTEQIRRYLREGRLPGQRIGGQWFIEASAVAAFSVRRPTEPSFLAGIRPTDQSDPLGPIIGIGAGGGSNIAAGKDSYRQAVWGRRRR